MEMEVENGRDRKKDGKSDGNRVGMEIYVVVGMGREWKFSGLLGSG